MIYTVTMNSSLDYIVKSDRIFAGSVNRAQQGEFAFGGKGLNQAAVLHALQIPVKAFSFAGGVLGTMLAALCEEAGFGFCLFPVSENPRVNLKLREEKETEINLPGPPLSQKDLAPLYAQLELLQPGDILSMGGSLPPGLPDDFYKNLAEPLPAGVRTVVDASGPALSGALKARPWLIKPNRDEAAEQTGIDPENPDFAVLAARELQRRGAKNVLLSLGADGAVLLEESGRFHRCAVSLGGKVQGTTGAGDSFLAGFLAAVRDDFSARKALAFAVDCGSLRAYYDGATAQKQMAKLFVQRRKDKKDAEENRIF